MSENKINKEYPEHLNPFSDDEQKPALRRSFRNSFRSLKNAIRKPFVKQRDKGHTGESEDVQLRNSVNNNTHKQRSKTMEQFPRSRFTERLNKTKTMSPDTSGRSPELHRNADPLNPFDGDDDDDEPKHAGPATQTDSAKTKENLKRYRRKKRAAPLPPHLRGDDLGQSDWSINSFETDYSAYTCESSEGDILEHAENLDKDIHELTADFTNFIVQADDQDMENSEKRTSSEHIPGKISERINEAESSSKTTNGVDFETSKTNSEAANELDLEKSKTSSETANEVDLEKSKTTNETANEVDLEKSKTISETPNEVDLEKSKVISETLEESEMEFSNNLAVSSSSETANPVTDIKESLSKLMHIASENLSETSLVKTEEEDEDDQNNNSTASETDKITQSADNLNYCESKSIYIAASKDDLDLNYHETKSIYLTGSRDELNSDSEDAPVPKVRKNKLSKETLLGVN